jgi:perosamine synthetase
MAIHREPPFHDEPVPHLPVTELLTENSLILPLYHELTEADQEFVIACLRRYLGASGN